MSVEINQELPPTEAGSAAQRRESVLESLAADVVVVGAGLGGLVSALAAQEDGARVVCIEKLAQPGGSFALAGGYVWTLDTLDEYRRQVPDGDASLGRILVDDFETGVEWLRDHGVRLVPLEGDHWEHKQAYRVRPETVEAGIMPLWRSFEAAGGHLLLNTACIALVQSDSGEISGVRYRDGEGVHQIDCRAVVLATGGFQGDLDLMTRYVSPWADRAWLRSNRGSTGDGLRLAVDAGAAVSRGMGMFYGHLLPAPPVRIDDGSFGALSVRYSEHCILVNQHGTRFVDESRRDAICAQALIREEQATGYVIFDRSRYESHVLLPHVPGATPYDPLKLIPDRGGTVLEASSLGALAGLLQETYGVSAHNVERTVAEFNAAWRHADPYALPIPRRLGLHACETPPFYAIAVRPGVTFTNGGVRVNTECQALDRDGRPIPGLFMAGVDVGAISVETYVGGLSVATVTGLRAGVFASRTADAIR